MKFRPILSLAVLCLFAASARAAELNLAGDWGVLLDPQNTGQTNGLQTPQYWEKKEVPSVKLPGSIQAQKVGDLPTARSPWTARLGLAMLNSPKYQPYQKEGEFKSPFWLTPDRVYVGSAWYLRQIDVPVTFTDQRVLLTLERPHWETTVFVDGKQVDMPQNSLGTAHVYDVTAALPPGKHTLILRVDNRLKIPVGNDASAVTDQSQSNWNGIVGDIKLSTTPKVFLDDVQIFPNLTTKKAKVRVTIGNKTGQAGKGTLYLHADSHSQPLRDLATPTLNVPVTWDASGGKAEVEYDMTGFPVWDEFTPEVYALEMSLKAEGAAGQSDCKPLFGLREITIKGPQFLLNGKPLQLRGNVDNCIFPLTGYPPTGPDGAAYWRKICTQLKACGLNHLRFHSWCPPEIAFQVADEMGLYFQIEAGVWAAFGSGNALDKWIVAETDAMLKAYGNHPSFLLLATANEPGSRTNQPNAAFLSALLTKWKAADPRHLYTAGSNWPNVPEADFQVMSRPRMNVSNELTRPPQTASDYSALVKEYANQPVISHETGQWCAYPNFDEIKKYTGTLHPGNLEIYKDFLDKAGMGDQAHDFLTATGKFQTLLYKEEIEAILRTPNLGGFQLLGLNDFSGQGTAPVGALDVFYDEKPYVTAAEYKRFAGDVVVLALLPKRIYTSDETLEATIKLSNYGPRPFAGSLLRWSLESHDPTETKAWKHGTIQSIPSPRVRARLGADAATAPVAEDTTTGLTTRGTLSTSFKDFALPAKLTLDVSNATYAPPGPSEPLIRNAWDIWVYPEKLDTTPPQNVTVTTSLSDTLTALAAGKNVLLLPGPNAIAGNTQGSFAPIFWNRITFPGAAVHTLSILCDPKHPAFKDFPTDSHSNWQWFELQQRTTCKPMLLTSLPKELKPLVQFIDDWDQARKLGLILEAKVGGERGGRGGGKLLLCAIDLSTNLNTRPVARQLLYSLQNYMASDKFNPPVTITEAQLRSLLQ